MKKNFDLYTAEIARLAMIKNGYTHVSFTLNSIPTQGSPTKDIHLIRFFDDVIVNKTINHHNGNVTIITNKAYFQFIKI